MLNKILERISGALTKDEVSDSGEREDAIELATAALMIEVARADHHFDPREFEKLIKLLEARLNLTPDAALLLSEQAETRVENSVSLYEFTRRLHDSLEPSEKSSIVDMLWQVAFADGRLDMYEDALILKLSDLLYVPRTEVMRLKSIAKKSIAH
ncbi:MAG: TerB family tellurite resistance protein [Pseudomonadota bacterium]